MKLFIAGHQGMVGSALVRLLQSRGGTKLLLRTRAELDLRDTRAVSAFYEKFRPDYAEAARSSAPDKTREGVPVAPVADLVRM